MPIKCCSNPVCSRPFQLNSYTFKAKPVLEPGKIICPNCGMVMKGNEKLVYSTHALSTKQEAQFTASFPLESFNTEALSLDTKFFNTKIKEK